MKSKMMIGMSLLIIFAMISNASACGYHIPHSVDSGYNMHWGGSVNSSFINELNAGINTWNALGKVNISKDTALTLQDITITYVNTYDPNEPTTPGVYNSNRNYIYFYKPVLDTFTYSERVKTATHELGHALGIGELSAFSGNIMKPGKSSQTYLGSKDKEVYNCLWR
ncbi:hypothetical protein MmiHf6_09850 [Methanimicrococcus hongohii]|uniref:Peptidase M10 metallopeptidase domain-containing protein n=1 Tax=Methanimicrococcus hongohii TaxID=3028295 RepID=A0AA96VB19_9EURY|nr:hypothetical protein [Methanimicrococcus sp. Hf6]WNY23672.1 hypothetical protein MmiHf6_09850 [Methanimicrococcus sp. Hf6]